MQNIHTVHIFLLLLLVSFGIPVFGQVDESVQTTSDTVYLYEEEVVYDTLYVYDSIVPDKPMTRAELLKALCADRGVGTLKYQKHHFYISTEEDLIKLEKPDLKELFSPSDYADYEKARKNQLKSIPLWVFGLSSVGASAWGLYKSSVGFYSEWLGINTPDGMSEDELKKSGEIGFAMFIVGVGAASLMLRYAVVLTNGGEDTCHRLARRFRPGNKLSYTPSKLSFGATSSGVGVTYEF